MGTNKRLEDLAAYKGVLPYASELYGVYQPLIGWKSKRTDDWLNNGGSLSDELVLKFLPFLENQDTITFNQDCAFSPEGLRPGDFRKNQIKTHAWIVLQEIAKVLNKWRDNPVNLRSPRDAEEWSQIINDNTISEALGVVQQHYQRYSTEFCNIVRSEPITHDHPFLQNQKYIEESNQHVVKQKVDTETMIAGILLKLLNFKGIEILDQIFMQQYGLNYEKLFQIAMETSKTEYKDPFLSFDPSKGTADVNISPLGIVHLFRQYFFELDTFLGTPVGHVWLSPGSTVELVESSTRKTIVEKTTEVSVESIKKAERATTDQDDISTSIKQDNKDDLKLGVTATVNQSWGTGNASASASLNMDKTQQTARENTHKRMRQQSEKISSELKESYKTTLRTVTESTDTNSKRYVIANTTQELLNYEFRRKMRQVGVQVQDIGSYLCWETFVDNPGAALGRANLVHLAKPADLAPLPDPQHKDYPPERNIAFTVNAAWTFPDEMPAGFHPLAELTSNTLSIPDGYEIVPPCAPGQQFPLAQLSGSGEDFSGVWAFAGVPQDANCTKITVGVVAYWPLDWDERVDFVLGGTLRVRPNETLRKAVDAENIALSKLVEPARRENDEKARVAAITAIQERIELARDIKQRNAEDLREEERIIVYRNLISSLMTTGQYRSASPKTRHTLSVLINTVFDIDKMLYFVAPEWWKPRDIPAKKIALGPNDMLKNLPTSIVSWDGEQNSDQNYLITGKSSPAPMGSSLGWVLQLDGDNMRNAFLNAPWVKSVIPIRPGKEKAALVWLQGAGVEGTEGLGFKYSAPDDELIEIMDKLNNLPNRPRIITNPHDVTIQDALNYLCETVVTKDAESKGVKKYPMTEINDDNKVSATPIEKVYEHGFYPLKGGFRVQPDDRAIDPTNVDPNNTDKNFQIFDQWVEVVPTDQIVPVKVEYDPRTGRQL
jgi:hypothetical protein